MDIVKFMDYRKADVITVWGKKEEIIEYRFKIMDVLQTQSENIQSHSLKIMSLYIVLQLTTRWTSMHCTHFL